MRLSYISTYSCFVNNENNKTIVTISNSSTFIYFYNVLPNYEHQSTKRLTLFFCRQMIWTRSEMITGSLVPCSETWELTLNQFSGPAGQWTSLVVQQASDRNHHSWLTCGYNYRPLCRQTFNIACSLPLTVEHYTPIVIRIFHLPVK